MIRGTILAILALCFLPASASALSCVPLPAAQEVIQKQKTPSYYDSLIVATLEKTESDELKLTKVQNLVGQKVPNEVTVSDRLASSGWPMRLQNDQRYIFALAYHDKNWATDQCLGPLEISSEQEKELIQLAKVPDTTLEEKAPLIQRKYDTDEKLVTISLLVGFLLVCGIIFYLLHRHEDDELS